MTSPTPEGMGLDWLPFASGNARQPRLRLLPKCDRAGFSFDLLKPLFAVRSLLSDDFERPPLPLGFRQRAFTLNWANSRSPVLTPSLSWHIQSKPDSPPIIFPFNVASLTRPCRHALSPALAWLRRRHDSMIFGLGKARVETVSDTSDQQACLILAALNASLLHSLIGYGCLWSRLRVRLHCCGKTGCNSDRLPWDHLSRGWAILHKLFLTLYK